MEIPFYLACIIPRSSSRYNANPFTETWNAVYIKTELRL